MLLVLQIHATIPTSSKSLMEEGVRKQLAAFMANQDKLGVGPEGVSLLLLQVQIAVGGEPAASAPSSQMPYASTAPRCCSWCRCCCYVLYVTG